MVRAAQLKPRKTPRQQRSRDTVAAILEAATQVLVRRGYAGATTDAIAERAGVSVGSVYQYFPNKDAILVALVERHIEDGFGLVASLLDATLSSPPPAREMLRRFVETMMELHRRAPRLHRVLFEEAPLPRGLRRDLELRENAFAEQIARLLERLPDVEVANPELSAYILVRSVEGLVHDFVLHPPKEIEPEKFCDEVVDLLSRYLR